MRTLSCSQSVNVSHV